MCLTLSSLKKCFHTPHFDCYMSELEMVDNILILQMELGRQEVTRVPFPRVGSWRAKHDRATGNVLEGAGAQSLGSRTSGHRYSDEFNLRSRDVGGARRGSQRAGRGGARRGAGQGETRLPEGGAARGGAARGRRGSRRGVRLRWPFWRRGRAAASSCRPLRGLLGAVV